ncbi:MAG: glycosyltransferase [Deltaproteobacteria bacterium]|nr:glycosyltransferase [Deltaproteobacteria bacterium]
MRVLLVHQYYAKLRGAFRVLLGVERALLDAGHEPVVFASATPVSTPCPFDRYFPEGFTRSDWTRGGWARSLRLAARGIYSLPAREGLRRLVAEIRPQVAVVLRPEHQLSYSVLPELRDSGIPVVLWFVDYRFWCTAGQFYNWRLRQPCFRCADGAHWNAVRFACAPRSWPMSLYGAAARYVWRATVRLDETAAVFVVPSLANRDILERWTDVPIGRMRVVAHPLEAADFASPSRGAGDYFAFYGQLLWEKGVHTLLQAIARLPDARLEIWGIDSVGLAPTVRALAGELGLLSRVRIDTQTRHGPVLLDRLAGALAVVVSSECPDMLDYAVLEGMAAGKAVIVGDRGGNAEIVRDAGAGWVFRAGDPESLADTMREVQSDPHEAERRGAAGRRHLEHRWRTGEFGKRLREVIEEAMATGRHGTPLTHRAPRLSKRLA